MKNLWLITKVICSVVGILYLTASIPEGRRVGKKLELQSKAIEDAWKKLSDAAPEQARKYTQATSVYKELQSQRENRQEISIPIAIAFALATASLVMQFIVTPFQEFCKKRGATPHPI